MEANLQRFFKVLMPGFHTKIMLPPAMHNELLVGEEAKESELISRKGRWKVIIMRSCEGRLWFTDGWDEFVRQHDLALGDFVVFKHIGALQFKVTLFDPSCCEKHFPVLQPQTNSYVTDKTMTYNKERRNHAISMKLKENNQEVHGQKQIDGEKPNNLGLFMRKRGRPAKNKISMDQSQLSLVMKPYNIRNKGSYLYLHGDFCRANGLNQDKRMTVKGPSGECKINFLRGNRCSFLCKDWHKFVVLNRLKTGDTCIVRPRNSSSGCTAIDIEVHRVK